MSDKGFIVSERGHPIAKWLEALKAVEHAKDLAAHAEVAAAWCELPKNMRPAKPSDIVEGAIIWYPERRRDYPLETLGPPSEACMNEAQCWEFVEEVLHPRDPWKAFNAYSGCRYGLDGAFVEEHPDRSTVGE